MNFGTKVKVGSSLITFGDSITYGSAASDTNHRYANIVNSKIGGTLYNQAVSGTGMANQSRNAFPIIPIKNSAVVSVMAGFNDLLREGAASFNKIESNLRAFITNALLVDAVPASICRSNGTWVSAGSSDGGKAINFGGNGLYTTGGTSNYLEWDFFGETLVVGSWTTTSGANGGTYKDFDISIDGGTPVTFFANGATNDAYPATNYNTKVLLNLGYGKHTVRVSPKSSGAYTIIDYFGTLSAPGATAPVLVAEIPSMTTWTYNGNTLSPTTLADANTLIASVVSEFSAWPVRLVPTNSFYTPGAGYTSADGQHPSDGGMAQIASAFMSQISLSNY